MSKLHSYILLNCLTLMAMPFAANAAGTYYTGAAYQPAQYRYGQSGTYASSGYNNMNYVRPTNATSGVRYNNYSAMDANSNYQNENMRQQQSRSTQNTQQSNSKNGGFFVNGGLTHETAMWKLEMKKDANSILRYDDIAWNVFDLNGGYVFGLGNTKMQIDAGFKYGMQWNEATMIDDDITKGGYLVGEWTGAGDSVVYQVGHALSIGTSKDGNMLGFNAGLGLNDFLKWGGVKITPSIGYRYLKYKLETRNNSGLMVDTLAGSGTHACITYSDGETQCDTVLIFYNDDFDQGVIDRLDTDGDGIISSNDKIPVPSGYAYVYAGNTTYYTQTGISHSYETEWSGPYIALDMIYDINQNNSVNGRVELGFPGYKSTGDQPYRPDWAHPKSVEDSADMFSAMHLGFAANWTTAISNSVSLSLGLTYDHYSVSGATSKTFLDSQYYTALYNSRLQIWENAGRTEEQMLNSETGDPIAIGIVRLKSDCPGWVCESKKEIDSIYKSMGIRIGFDARF